MPSVAEKLDPENTKLKIGLELYYDKLASYSKTLQEILDLISSIQKEKSFELRLVEKSELSTEEMKAVISKIRSVYPQARGAIRTSRNNLLPLSNSKNLNLTNTPVLIVKSEQNVVYVFPCRIGESYFDIGKGIQHLSRNLPNFPPLEGKMEDAIIDHFLSNLDAFENGLKKEQVKFETSVGEADVLLRDAQGLYILVEVEREANDHALGQVLRLAAGFAKTRNLQKEKLRVVIASERKRGAIEEAARWANVEVWTIPKNG